jgi:hypothetical protein
VRAEVVAELFGGEVLDATTQTGRMIRSLKGFAGYLYQSFSAAAKM